MLDKEIRDKLESQYGPVAAIECDGETFAFRCPARADLDRRNTRKKNQDTEADERMLRECCVYEPTEGAFSGFLDRRPFAVIELFETYRAAFGAKRTEPDPASIPTDAAGDRFILFPAQGNGEKDQVIGINRPGRAQAKRFMSEMKGDTDKAEATLARACLSFHSQPFDAWLESHPFAMRVIADEAVLLGGFASGAVGDVGK